VESCAASDAQMTFAFISEHASDVVAVHNVTDQERTAPQAGAPPRLFEAALKESELRYRLIAENSTDIIVVTTLKGRFDYLSPGVRRVGHEPADLIGRSAVEMVHPDDIDLLNGAFARQLTQASLPETVERVRWRGRHGKTGDWVWMESSPGLMRDPETGEPRGFIDLVRDISNQVRQEAELAQAQAQAARAAEALRQSEARYRMIAENTSDIIVMSDRNARITFISPSISQLGIDPATMLGGTFVGKIHHEDGVRMWGILQAQTPADAGEKIRWRCRHQVTGEWVWMESMPKRLWDPETGEPLGYVDVVRNVSLQVEQEEALATARADAEAALQVKSQFLANMSHEIRTPLTAVLGYSDMLATMTDLDAHAQTYARRISSAGSALLAIINDILDFSKLEAGMVDVRPQPTDVARIIDDTLVLFEGRAAEKGLALSQTIAPDVPQGVLLDGDRLRQILVNLTGNAVKFTDSGQVSIRVDAMEGGQSLRFEVEDTGPGLDAAQCARLFQRFSQIDGSLTRRHGGTGLGLAICKGLAEAMGGSIGVISQPGKGSVFHLTLPLQAAELDEVAPAEAEAISFAGRRVLVVDDNATNRELARRILEMFEFEISEADGGDSALDRLLQLPFDLVLLDVRMPDLDGREVLTRLRANAGPNRRTPVLAFTADAEAGHGNSLDAFDGIVRKPMDTMGLVAEIARAIAADAGEPAAGTNASFA
jgi:PAS domain S-box-containing protein